MDWKKKGKIVLLVLAVGCVLYVMDLFLGNPVSYGIVRRNAQAYLKETYPQLPLRVEEISHDWYNGGGYDVRVVCDGSRDTQFELIYNRLGRLTWDGYDMTVASGNATLSRLYDEYAGLVRETVAGVLGEHVCFAGLSSVDEYTGTSAPLLKGIKMEELVLDGEYDVAVMGAEYGYISLNIVEEPDAITMETAERYLIAVNDALKEKGIGYVFMDLCLTARDTKDQPRSLTIERVTPGDLEGENAAARLEQLRQQTEG